MYKALLLLYDSFVRFIIQRTKQSTPSVQLARPLPQQKIALTTALCLAAAHPASRLPPPAPLDSCNRAIDNARYQLH